MRSHKTRSKRDRSIPRSLQRWVSSKILDLAASWRSSVLYHSSEVVTVYQRTIYCECCQCTGQDRIAHTSSVWYHRVQTTGCAAVLTDRQLFSYTTWDDLAGPMPAPHITRFEVCSDEPVISKMAYPPLIRRGLFWSLAYPHFYTPCSILVTM